MAGYYDSAILEALRKADRPLRHREIATILAPNDPHYQASRQIGGSLTKLYRDGWLKREKADGRYWHYTLAPERRVIEPGYIWRDEHGPIRVLAVAEGWAMCRRPGAMPFVRTVNEIQDEKKASDQ